MQADDTFKVLKISNITFPNSNIFGASFNAPFEKDFREFTICLRFLLSSYQDGILSLYGVKNQTTGNLLLVEHFGWKEEMTTEYQAGVTLFARQNIPGGGLGKRAFPWYHNFDWPKTVEILKWNHYCISYSSINHMLQLYQDGMKAYSFRFAEENEDPLPAKTFEKVEHRYVK